MVAAAAAGRLRRRGEDAPLRRSHLRAIERRGGRRHAVPAGAKAQHLGLHVGAEAAEPRPLLRRGRQRRLRRDRLRHRCLVLSRSRMDGRPDADEAPRQVACARRPDAALCRKPERVVGQSDEFGRLLFLRVRNQNSVLVNLPVAGRARFPADADHRVFGPPGKAEHPRGIDHDRRGLRSWRRDSETASRTTCRSCRRSRSGCSAIATIGIRRTRSPTTRRRASASRCPSSTRSSRRAFPKRDRRPRRRRAGRRLDAHDSARRRIRSSRRSRSAISAS